MFFLRSVLDLISAVWGNRANHKQLAHSLTDRIKAPT